MNDEMEKGWPIPKGQFKRDWARWEQDAIADILRERIAQWARCRAYKPTLADKYWGRIQSLTVDECDMCEQNCKKQIALLKVMANDACKQESDAIAEINGGGS